MRTYRCLERAPLRSAIERSERHPRFHADPVLGALIKDARAKIETVPVASFMSSADELVNQLSDRGRLDVAASHSFGTLRDSWSRDFTSRYAQARELVARANAQLNEPVSGLAQ